MALTSTSTVRDFSHRNFKISHLTGIGANFSDSIVKNFHRAVIFTVQELAYNQLFILC
jgi:hypothetical protein